MNKYDNHFKKLTKEDVLGLWDKNEYPINVYIHSPFCASVCRYCFYKGRVYDEDEYNRYYTEYLPNRIRDYNSVIKNQEINSWFFGGGTPSLMTPKDLESTLCSFPAKINTEGEKTIEIHPGLWNVDQLDVLKAYNFDNVIIGIQTMDKDTLKKQNRFPHNPGQVVALVKQCRARGFNVLFDVIGFLNSWIEDAQILRNDLEFLYQFEPEEISVQTTYLGKDDFDDRLVKEALASKFDSSGKYSLEIESDTYEELLKNFSSSKCLRLFRNDKIDDYKNNKFFKFITGMDENWVSEFEVPVSTLGIGAYKNTTKDTFSNITGDIHYIEINDNWEPKYYGVKTLSFFDEARKLLDVIEERYGDPPKGMELTIKNLSTFSRDEDFEELPGNLEFSFSYDKEAEIFIAEELNQLMKKRLNDYQKKFKR